MEIGACSGINFARRVAPTRPDGVRKVISMKALILAVAISLITIAMLSIGKDHHFLRTGAVIPLLLIAVIAEQINR